MGPAGLAPLLLLALAAAACSPEADPAHAPPTAAASPADRGRALFERRVGGLSCADCHSRSAEDQPDRDRRRVGHTLADATRRPSWWHGALDAAKGATVGDAALTCVARFQQRSWNTVLPVTPDGGRDLSKVEVPPADLAAIVSYLDTLARPGPHPPSPAARDSSREALARVAALPGDADRGRAVFAAACALCHGSGGPDALGPTLRDDTAPDARRVIAYVRSGPGDAERRTGDAWMPFFTPDALPDQDLADLAALVGGGKW